MSTSNINETKTNSGSYSLDPEIGGKSHYHDSPPPHDLQPTQQPETIRVQPAPTQTPSTKFAKVFETEPLGTYQSFVASCGSFFGCLGTIPCCLCCSNPYTQIKQGNVGLVTRFGELARVVDPGSNYVNIFSEDIQAISVMTEVNNIPEQACMTKDNVTVHLNSVIYYNIVDPQKATFGIRDVHDALSQRTQTTLRDVVGARSLQDIIEHREELAEAIQLVISETVKEWGVVVESILIKDLRLEHAITDSLSKAAQAKRIGESKIITAKAEVESAKLMRQAADILASKPAMQIRYLDAMQSMAKSAGSKVIFMPSSSDIGKAADQITGEEDNNKLFSTKDLANTITVQEALSNK